MRLLRNHQRHQHLVRNTNRMSEQDNNALEEAPCAIPHSAVAKAVGEAADQESSQLPAKGKDRSGDPGKGLHFTIEGRHG